MNEETVTITKKMFDELVKRDTWLTYLEAAGVDNWQGIDEAYQLAENDGVEV